MKSRQVFVTITVLAGLFLRPVVHADTEDFLGVWENAAQAQFKAVQKGGKLQFLFHKWFEGAPFDRGEPRMEGIVRGRQFRGVLFYRNDPSRPDQDLDIHLTISEDRELLQGKMARPRLADEPLSYVSVVLVRVRESVDKKAASGAPADAVP